MLYYSIRRAFACLTVAVVALSAGIAHAGAPQVKTQAPGYYRMMLGDFEITALFDGALDLEPKKLLTNTTAAEVGRLLERSFEADAVPTSVNTYLVNTGSQLILIDSGTGQLFGPSLGKLRANLEAAGYRMDQVDAVLITHMHGDHVGGLVDADKLAFANATVHVDRHDAEFWLSQANLEKASADAKDFFKMATTAFAPVVAAGRLKTFDGSGDLFRGIRAVATPGHTPGHTIYRVESKGNKLVLWGDLMHVAAVQFPQPEVTIQFDTDSAAARQQRLRFYAEAAQGRTLIGSAHLPFPGLGHLRAEGKGYAWVPIDYTPIK